MIVGERKSQRVTETWLLPSQASAPVLGHQPSDFFFVERKRNPRGWRHRSLWFLFCASRLSLYLRRWAWMSLCWVRSTWQALCPVTPRRLRCSEIKQCTQCHMDLPVAVTYSWRPPQWIQLFNYCQKYDTRSHPKPKHFFFWPTSPNSSIALVMLSWLCYLGSILRLLCLTSVSSGSCFPENQMFCVWHFPFMLSLSPIGKSRLCKCSHVNN